MAQVPLGELVTIEYLQGPQMIKSEDTFLVGYVLFDKKEGNAEVDVVEDAQEIIDSKIKSGELIVPAGVSYKFSGSFENQVRAVKRLSIVIPICLLIIFMLLFFQFKTITASLIHFSGVFVAFAGGFIMIWLWGQDWFMNFNVSGINIFRTCWNFFGGRSEFKSSFMTVWVTYRFMNAISFSKYSNAVRPVRSWITAPR